MNDSNLSQNPGSAPGRDRDPDKFSIPGPGSRSSPGNFKTPPNADPWFKFKFEFNYLSFN